MEKKIVLITREFPYGKSETFLETEIVILSRKFDRIVVYPTVKSTSIRNIPSNVSVNNSLADITFSKMHWFLKLIFYGTFYSSLYQYRKDIGSVRSLLFFTKYFMSYLRYKHFAKLHVAQFANTLIYSYWFSPVVDVLVNLKTENSAVVTRVHRTDLYEEFNPMGFFPHRAENIHKISKIYSISLDGLNYLKRKFNCENIEVSRLGIFDNSVLNSADLRAFSIVSVSNLIQIKRVDLIAKTIVEYAKINPTKVISWNHFGDGDQYGKIIDIINSYQGKNIECKFNGRVSNKDIYRFYATNPVDVLINLSVSEGIPVSIMEALSYGIPVIATNVGGVLEIVTDVNGILLTANPSVQEVLEAYDQVEKLALDRAKIKLDWQQNYSAETNYTNFSNSLIAQLPNQKI